MAKTKPPWRERLAKATVRAAAILLVLAAALQWFIIPALVRSEVRRRLAGFWDGTVTIGEAGLSLNGRTANLDDVALRDHSGRVWLRAASVDISVEDLLSGRPAVRGLRTFDTEVIVHCDDGACRPPLPTAGSDKWSKLLDLDYLEANQATVTIRDNGQVVNRASVPRVSYERDAKHGPELQLCGSVGTFDFTDIEVDGFVTSENSIELDRLVARLGGGRVIVTGRADKAPDGQWRATGRVVAAKVDLGQLKMCISGGERGILTGMMDARMGLADANGPSGTGMAFLEGAELSGAPMATTLLGSAGMQKTDNLGNTSVNGLFHFRGTAFVFDQARLSLPLAAVDIEPGATVDVSTGRFEGVAVVVLFDRARNGLKMLPVVGLMMDLTEHFSRFRVRGSWQNNDNVEVTPAAGDVTGQTKKFLSAAATGRVGLGHGILDVLSMAAGTTAPTTRSVGAPTTTPATRPANDPLKQPMSD